MTMKIGFLIKELRFKERLTQKQLADKLGYSTISIHYYEKGIRSPSPKMLKRLAKVFPAYTGQISGSTIENKKSNQSIILHNNTLLIESQKETIRLQKERITQLEETSNAGLCYNPNHK